MVYSSREIKEWPCPHKVPLNSISIELLLQAKAHAVDNTNIFQSPVKLLSGKPMEVRTLSRSIARKHTTLGIDKFVPHDLRRTARTKFAQLKISDIVAERILNHSLQGMARVYNHHDYISDMREALSVWDQHLRKTIRS